MTARAALTSLSALLLVACQVALGDFTIDSSQLGCTPGELRCNTAALEQCGSDGKWGALEQCLNEVLCNLNTAHCDSPACAKGGALRCQDNTQQRCRQNQTGWDDVTRCTSPQSCDPAAGCLSTPCTSGDFRCNDVTLETCTGGAWVFYATCETNGLCNAAQHVCVAPACALDERQCQGNVLRRCKADRSGWTEQTCSLDFTCNPDTKRCEAR